MTKIVNSLTTKMQIGGPMAAAYLLGQPGHYTSHDFQTFFWKPYVREVQTAWGQQPLSTSVESMEVEQEDKVIVQKRGNRYVAMSKLMDYTMRPPAFEDISLFDWIRPSHKLKGTPKNPTQGRPRKTGDVTYGTDLDEEEDEDNGDDKPELCDSSDDEDGTESDYVKLGGNKRKAPSADTSLEDLLCIEGHPQR
jgi:hypothetical protein